MKSRYYVIEGLQPWSKADEKRINSLIPQSYIGNSVEYLLKRGYYIDAEQMKLFSPEGIVICNMTEAM